MTRLREACQTIVSIFLLSLMSPGSTQIGWEQKAKGKHYEILRIQTWTMDNEIEYKLLLFKLILSRKLLIIGCFVQLHSNRLKLHFNASNFIICQCFFMNIYLDVSHFIFFRWLSKASVMPAGPESDCFIIVGVSRPKLAALFLSVMLISLFLTFHILYDSAVYSIQVSLRWWWHRLLRCLFLSIHHNKLTCIFQFMFAGCHNHLR